MIKSVKIGPYDLYADDTDEDITGRKILQNGLNFERHVYAEIVRLLPHSTGFIDIGSNVGLYAVAVRALAPNLPIVAVEVSAKNTQILLRTLSENKIRGVDVLNVALADCPRIVFKNRNPINTTCVQVASDLEYTFALPLDYFNLPQANLVKMDIEGFEYLALRGMSHFINQNRPRIIFEYYREGTKLSGCAHPTELLNSFLDLGYKLTVLDYIPGTRKEFLDAEECDDYVVSVSKWITDILAEPL